MDILDRTIAEAHEWARMRIATLTHSNNKELNFSNGQKNDGDRDIDCDCFLDGGNASTNLTSASFVCLAMARSSRLAIPVGCGNQRHDCTCTIYSRLWLGGNHQLAAGRICKAALCRYFSLVYI